MHVVFLGSYQQPSVEKTDSYTLCLCSFVLLSQPPARPKPWIIYIAFFCWNLLQGFWPLIEGNLHLSASTAILKSCSKWGAHSFFWYSIPSHFLSDELLQSIPDYSLSMFCPFLLAFAPSLCNMLRSISYPNKTLPCSCVHLYLPPYPSILTQTSQNDFIHTFQNPHFLPSVPGFPFPYLCSRYYLLVCHASPGLYPTEVTLAL